MDAVMFASPDEALAAPLRVLQQCFERQLGPAEEGFGLKQLIEQFLTSAEFYQKIPVITPALAKSGNLVPNCLVRYRGIVQDTFDNEYFLGVYTSRNRSTGEVSTHPAIYQDSISINPNDFDVQHDERQNFERHPLFCAPVPGDSHWAQQPSASLHSTTIPATVGMENGVKSKRNRDDNDHDAPSGDNDDSVFASPTAALREQRARHESIAPEVNEDQPSMETNSHEQHGSADAMGHANLLEIALGPQPFVRDPLNHGCCFVKVYGDSGLKIGEVVEFVGIYTCETELGAELGGQCDDPFSSQHLPMEETIARNPPTSIVPRVHAITFRQLSAAYPLVHSFVAQSESSHTISTMHHSSENAAVVGPWCAETHPAEGVSSLLMLPQSSLEDSIQQSRQGVIDLLASALEADVLAAEYVMLAMLSRVTNRTDSMIVGNLAINLTNCEETIPSFLSAVIADLMPRMVQVEMTVDNLNKGQLYCKKDYTRNRLKPSALQLQPGTVVVVDETKMVEGQLTELGLKDLAVLGKVIQRQSLPIDFEYYHMDFPTDLPIVCCSSGRSMLPGMVPVKVIRGGPVLGGAFLGDFEPLRLLLAVGRTIEPSLSAEFCEMAQEEFVAARHADSSIQQQELHLWLNLSRLIAASCGSQTVERVHWDRMRSLEQARNARLHGPVGELNIIPEY